MTSTITVSTASQETKVRLPLRTDELKLMMEALGKGLDADFAAVYVYTTTLFSRLNKALREGQDVDYCEVLDRALDKITPQWGGYYRALDKSAFDSIKFEEDGEVYFEDKAYLSSSLHRSGIESFISCDPEEQCILRLYGRGYDISGYSEYPSEKEFLFPRNVRFRLLEVTQDDRDPDIPVYHLEQVV